MPASVTQKFGNSKREMSSLVQKTWIRQGSHVGRPRKKTTVLAETAHRMTVLRVYLGLPTQSAMAHFLGISTSRWNNVEGRTPVSGAIMDMLVRKIPGLTSDWIRYGNEAGLPMRLVEMLRAADEKVQAGEFS